jgi:signal transduction histidine kinase
MKFNTINGLFKRVYFYLLLVACIGFGIISYSFGDKLIQNNIQNLVFKHSVKSKSQVDQLLGFKLIGNSNAINYHLSDIKKNEGLEKVYVSSANPCGSDLYCKNKALQIITPIPELKEFLVKNVKVDNLLWDEIFSYLSSSIGMFVFCLLLSWYLLTKLIETRFLNIISDFRSTLLGEKTSQRSALKEVSDLLEQNKAIVKKAEKVRIAQQVAHDIQSPLEILKTLKDNLSAQENSTERDAVNEAINRIIAISDDLLEREATKYECFRPRLKIQEIIREKNKLYPNMGIVYTRDGEEKEVNFNITYFERILSNLINNSFEAHSTTVTINTTYENDEFVLRVSDNGNGIEAESLENIFSEGFSTKSNGHGIGLFAAKVYVEKYGGKIHAESYENGFTVEIKLPLRANNKKYVLIDDDKLTRLNWTIMSKRKNLDLSTYSSVEEFLASSSKFDPTTEVFIDSQLGHGIKGEKESKKIFDLGFENIRLATGANKNDVDIPFWVKSVQGKAFDVL